VYSVANQTASSTTGRGRERFVHDRFGVADLLVVGVRFGVVVSVTAVLRLRRRVGRGRVGVLDALHAEAPRESGGEPDAGTQ